MGASGNSTNLASGDRAHDYALANVSKYKWEPSSGSSEKIGAGPVTSRLEGGPPDDLKSTLTLTLTLKNARDGVIPPVKISLQGA